MTVQWLWSPTEEELLTTRFMRNRALFQTLAEELVPKLRQHKRGPLRILFWAASTGCEPYTLRLLMGPEGADDLHATDISPEAIRIAEFGKYEPRTWHSLLAPHHSLLTPEEVARLFDMVRDEDGEVRGVVRPEYRRGIHFTVADLFQGSAEIPRASYDVVICNNLLLHLGPASAHDAIGLLVEYMGKEAVLVLSGCDRLVRSHASQLFSLWPYPEHRDEIHRGWDGVSCAWDLDPRPAWASPPVELSDPDHERKTCEIFCNFDPSRLSGDTPPDNPTIPHRIRDEATICLWDREPRLLQVPSLEELFEHLVYRADSKTVPALYQHTYYPYYYLLARYLELRSILEIGTRFGYSLIALTQGALAAAPPALVLKSIDVESYPNEFPASSQQVARENWKSCVACHRGTTEIDIQFIIGDSHKIRLPAGETYDLIHVDGDHTEAGALRDIVDYFPHLNPGGCLVIDDLDQPPVHRSYLRAVAALGIAPEHRTFLPTKHGLGILQRSDDNRATRVSATSAPAARRHSPAP